MSDIQYSPAYSITNLEPVPQDPPKSKIKKAIKKISILFYEGYNQVSQYANSSFSSKLSLIRVRNHFKKFPFLNIFLVIGAVLLFGYIILNGLNGQNAGVLGNLDQRVEIKKPKAQQKINRLFFFPLRDDLGVEVSKLKYLLERAELRDEIIVKGQRARSVKGRTFLIINVKISNDFGKPISLNSRDYIRLIVDRSSERLAPDIHNDPVEVQPISTKYTRVGFPINDTDKNLMLQVGEINGQKIDIKLDTLK